MKDNYFINKYTILASSSILLLAGCGSGGGAGSSASGDPGEALTDSITITGGTVVSGQPPAPTLNAGDPFISNPVVEAPTITPGMSSNLTVQIEDMPLDTTSFNINIQFDKTTNKYISVTIDDPDLISDLASLGGSGTINLPFAVDSSVCDNIDDIKHQIQCYETVALPDGSQVSQEVAQQMVLACGTGSGAVDTYFAEDPDSKFDLNNNPSDDLCIEVIGSAALINSENTRITNENNSIRQENGGVLPQDLEQSLFALGSCPAKYTGQKCVVTDDLNDAIVTIKFTPLAPPENVKGFCDYNGGTVQ